jgi:hypothetical protein
MVDGTIHGMDRVKNQKEKPWLQENPELDLAEISQLTYHVVVLG